MSDAEIRFSEAKPDTKKEKSAPPRKKSFARRIVSWSTLFNLLLLWVIVSLAQQVQRLRAEVAFVADEARDLRLFGFDRASAPIPTPTAEEKFPWEEDADEDVPTSIPLQLGTEPTGAEPATDTSDPEPGDIAVQPLDGNYDIGRVVFGRAGWQQWLQHPS